MQCTQRQPRSAINALLVIYVVDNKPLFSATVKDGLGGMFGALRDASLDHWGRRIIDRHFGSPAPDELDYLLESPDDRAGALCFGLNRLPPAPKRKYNRTLDLEKLQAFADAIIADEVQPDVADAEQAQELMLAGTSMGGARPKAVVEHEGALWIAKFNRPDDKWKLSPAYDLVPAMPVSRQHRDLALECGDWGRHANATNLLS